MIEIVKGLRIAAKEFLDKSVFERRVFINNEQEFVISTYVFRFGEWLLKGFFAEQKETVKFDDIEILNSQWVK